MVRSIYCILFALAAVICYNALMNIWTFAQMWGLRYSRGFYFVRADILASISHAVLVKVIAIKRRR